MTTANAELADHARSRAYNAAASVAGNTDLAATAQATVAPLLESIAWSLIALTALTEPPADQAGDVSHPTTAGQGTDTPAAAREGEALAARRRCDSRPSAVGTPDHSGLFRVVHRGGCHGEPEEIAVYRETRDEWPHDGAKEIWTYRPLPDEVGDVSIRVLPGDEIFDGTGRMWAFTCTFEVFRISLDVTLGQYTWLESVPLKLDGQPT